MPIPIHGKEYFTVAERVAKFREEHADFSITTDLVETGDHVVVKATISNGDSVIATGYAEEERGSTNINKTSAVENCETSAVGRALAFFGLAGTEIASADEVANAIAQQAEKVFYERAQANTKAILEHIDSIKAIKSALSSGTSTENLSVAAEAWFELSDDEKKSLWIAPSKGGAFTTKEREIMQSADFRKAHYGEE